MKIQTTYMSSDLKSLILPKGARIIKASTCDASLKIKVLYLSAYDVHASLFEHGADKVPVAVLREGDAVPPNMQGPDVNVHTITHNSFLFVGKPE